MNKKILLSALGILTVANFIYSKSSKNVDLKQSLDGTTELIEAVKCESKRAFNKALKYDNVNNTDRYGKTAMDYAAEKHNKKLVLELSKCHALVSSQENRVTVKGIVDHKAGLCKGLGIASFFFAPAAIITGTSILVRRSTWKNISLFYTDQKASLL